MSKCMNCGAELSNVATECPICKTKIPKDAIKTETVEQEQQENEKLNAAIEEHHKRRKLGNLFMGLTMLWDCVSVVTVALIGAKPEWVYVAVFAGFLIYFFGLIKFRINRCPHCESIMGRYPGTFCRNCGRRIDW